MIYRFRVGKRWFAYHLKTDAEYARNFFVKLGYADISQIEEAQEGQDFQIKL